MSKAKQAKVTHSLMQAIVTKYHGPTNTRGARISAKAQGGRVSIAWDYALNITENHNAAALALVTKMEWRGSLVGGGLPDSSGNAYVFTAVR